MKKYSLILLCVFFLSPAVRAIPVSGGEVFNVDWFVDLDDNLTSNDLTATSTWSISSYSASEIVIDIDIFNTTILGDGLDNAAITAFGFGVSPDATGVLSSAGAVFNEIGTGSGPQQTFPGGFKDIDICLYYQNCSGGNINDGLQAGDSDSLQITLMGTFGSSTDLLFYPAKFQSNLGSFQPGGTTNIPEPTASLLLGTGLIGMMLLRRRKR